MSKNKEETTSQSVDFKTTSIEDALEETGFGKFNVFLILTCGIVLYSINCECYSIGYILPAAECDLQLTVKEKSLLTSISFIGIMTTQFFWGFISDTRGRRNCLIYTLILAFAFTVASFLSPYLWLFIIFRYFNGFMISCSSGTIFAYLGEFIGGKYRQASVMSSCIFIGLALFLLPWMAWLILPLTFRLNLFGFDFLPWRFYVLICGIPSLLACIALLFFPESPKFLLQTGRSEEALNVLRTIHSRNNQKTEFPVKVLTVVSVTSNDRNLFVQFLQQIFALFKKEHVKNILLCCGLMFMIFVASSGMLLWYPDILLQVSRSNGEATVCQALDFGRVGDSNSTEAGSCSSNIDSSIFTQNIYIGVAYLAGFILNSVVVSRVGIKTLLVLLLGTSSLGTALLYWITNKAAIDVLFILILALSGLCVGLVNTAVVDMFPTSLRAMAGCLSMFSGRLGSVVSSSVFGYMLEWNCNATFFIYAGNLLCCGTLALFIPGRKVVE